MHVMLFFQLTTTTITTTTTTIGLDPDLHFNNLTHIETAVLVMVGLAFVGELEKIPPSFIHSFIHSFIFCEFFGRIFFSIFFSPFSPILFY